MSKTETTPQLDHETYMSIVTLKARQNEFKVQAFDIQNFISNQREYLTVLENALTEKKSAIQLSEIELRTLFNEKVEKPFGFEGQKVSIVETEPHYILLEGQAPPVE